MASTVYATQTAHVAGAARPCAGFGRNWRHVGNGMGLNVLVGLNGFMKSIDATATKRSTRHLGMAST